MIGNQLPVQQSTLNFLCSGLNDSIPRVCSPHSNDKVIYPGAMTRATTLIITAVAFLCIAAASSPPVTFESPCSCRDNHGKHRWAVKNDPPLPACGCKRDSSRYT